VVELSNQPLSDSPCLDIKYLAHWLLQKLCMSPNSFFE
jgi:hypothetical protein